MPVPLVERSYVVGDLVKLTCRFQDPVTLAFVQPSGVTCEIMDPNGAVTTPAPIYNTNLETLQADGTTLTAPGYYTEVDVELPGRWYYRFAATGTGQAADESAFYVERSKFG